jgi:peptidoglycan/xylan/chitin deacetylase (PgdA/CDA1 family)
MKMLTKQVAIIVIIAIASLPQALAQKTTITKWQDDKRAAVSLTFDDGTRNQFTVALPMLNQLTIPATFYIITGDVAGSKYHGKFIGRPVQEIIRGTADTPTHKDNFFERASAIGFLGYKGTLTYHTNAGTLFEQEKYDEAYKLIDTAYMKVRNNEFEPANKQDESKKHLTWEAVRQYARQGHEFGSHTVTHPRLAVLTEPNMLYELEKSKEEIRDKLGEKYTFSAECPYGTEDERVMEYAYKIYPSLRNRMPEKYLEELNRSSKVQPGTLKNEYIQWQRGAVTRTSLPLMKSWVDTVAAHDNNWLVLVFHGVDGIGWEALSSDTLREYFQYIKDNDDKLWIATFADATKYIRQRMNASVNGKRSGDNIVVELTHKLDKKMYDLPLTLKTYVPSTWARVRVKQGKNEQTLSSSNDDQGTFVLYRMQPNMGKAILHSSL